MQHICYEESSRQQQYVASHVFSQRTRSPRADEVAQRITESPALPEGMPLHRVENTGMKESSSFQV